VRDRLIRAGTRNVERFSWEACATGTLHAYAEAFRTKSRRSA